MRLWNLATVHRALSFPCLGTLWALRQLPILSQRRESLFFPSKGQTGTDPPRRKAPDCLRAHLISLLAEREGRRLSPKRVNIAAAWHRRSVVCVCEANPYEPKNQQNQWKYGENQIQACAE